MELNKIYNDDCLEGMQRIPDKSVDLILCDLPYGTTACKWDIVIPFEPLWNQYERIIKDNGAIVLTASQPFASSLVMSNPKLFREEIIWLKNRAGSGMQANRKHIKVHESILLFSKSGKYTYNPQMWEAPSKEFLTHRKVFKAFECGNTIYGSASRIRKRDDGIRNPISIVSYAVPVTPAYSKMYLPQTDLRLHPTQKPVALFEYLIKTYTNEGETVLDNCMGSGTTAIACINTGRNYIGFENEHQYWEISQRRIKSKPNK